MWTSIYQNRMLFEDIPLLIKILLPPEIWYIIHKFYIEKCLIDNLQFPMVLNIRMNDDFFADYWQAYCGGHYWEIESANDSESTLISHFFNKTRSSLDWSGLKMFRDERVFGAGFLIDDTFLNIFLDDDDIPYFPNIPWSEYDSDDFFIL